MRSYCASENRAVVLMATLPINKFADGDRGSTERDGPMPGELLLLYQQHADGTIIVQQDLEEALPRSQGVKLTPTLQKTNTLSK